MYTHFPTAEQAPAYVFVSFESLNISLSIVSQFSKTTESHTIIKNISCQTICSKNSGEE